MDIAKLIADKIQHTEETKLESIVQTHVEKMLTSIVSDLTSNYGDVAREVKAHLQKILGANFEHAQVEQYNARVVQIYQNAIGKFLDEKVSAPIESHLKEFATTLKKGEYKLSEIIEDYIKSLADHEWGDKSSLEPTVIVEISNYGSTHLHFDHESNKRRFECRYGISINSKSGEVYAFDIRGHFGSSTTSSLHGFDRFVFALGANKSKIIIDEYQEEFYRDED